MVVGVYPGWWEGGMYRSRVTEVKPGSVLILILILVLVRTLLALTLTLTLNLDPDSGIWNPDPDPDSDIWNPDPDLRLRTWIRTSELTSDSEPGSGP